MSCCEHGGCGLSNNEPVNIKETVKQKYGEIAAVNLEAQSAAFKNSAIIAESFGYSKQDLENVPGNMGLSCGNPVAIASLKEGEIVVDLGSGGGMDCFLAAKKVGPKGKVIGVDMTPTMIELANKNKTKTANSDHVEFRLGEIENLPVQDNFADVVISNCVINLVPDKSKAYQEIYRILKHGGRVAISDICLKKELPDTIKSCVETLTGCISGALLVLELRNIMQKAGFEYIDYVDTKSDLNIYSSTLAAGPSCCGDTGSCDSNSCGITYSKETLNLLKDVNVNDYASSYKIFAIKSEKTKSGGCSDCSCDGHS